MNSSTSSIDHDYLNTDLVGVILSNLPYFYQFRYKRVNKTWKETIELIQKRSLSERFRNAPRPDRIEYIAPNELQKIHVQLNDLKLVEKQDVIKFKLNYYLNNSKSVISFLKQFYYLDNLEWLIQGGNVEELDTEEANDSSKIAHKLKEKYFFSLTLIGLNYLSESLLNYLEGLKHFGISLVNFMFCSKSISISDISKSPIFIKIFDSSKYNSNNGSGLVYGGKRPIKSVQDVTNYIKACSLAFGVHSSWITTSKIQEISNTHCTTTTQNPFIIERYDLTKPSRFFSGYY